MTLQNQILNENHLQVIEINDNWHNKKTHPKGIPNGSLGMLISTIELVAEHVLVNARDILTTNWMSHNPRPMKTKHTT
jgi:hypothetical protein